MKTKIKENLFCEKWLCFFDFAHLRSAFAPTHDGDKKFKMIPDHGFEGDPQPETKLNPVSPDQPSPIVSAVDRLIAAKNEWESTPAHSRKKLGSTGFLKDPETINAVQTILAKATKYNRDDGKESYGVYLDSRPTGTLDKATKKAIYDFQRTAKISKDSVVGPQTTDRLLALAGQIMLREAGHYNATLDGIQGKKTRAGLRKISGDMTSRIDTSNWKTVCGYLGGKVDIVQAAVVKRGETPAPVLAAPLSTEIIPDFIHEHESTHFGTLGGVDLRIIDNPTEKIDPREVMVQGVDDFGNKIILRAGVFARYLRAREIAKKYGAKLFVRSSYRSYWKQKIIYQRWIANRKARQNKLRKKQNSGETLKPYELRILNTPAKEAARSAVSKPGNSWHHAGNALDIYCVPDDYVHNPRWGSKPAPKYRRGDSLKKFQKNLLPKIMIEARFVNYEDEYWHWESHSRRWHTKYGGDLKNVYKRQPRYPKRKIIMYNSAVLAQK